MRFLRRLARRMHFRAHGRDLAEELRFHRDAIERELVARGHVALSLAAVGIYGLIAFSVAQRTRELGIRMALGALPRDVLLLVVRQGARLALAGIVVGGLGAIVSTRWMGSMLFQVDPLDPVTFAIVGVALAAVAVGATWAPARRAARVSPVTAMRME